VLITQHEKEQAHFTPSEEVLGICFDGSWAESSLDRFGFCRPLLTKPASLKGEVAGRGAMRLLVGLL